MVEQVFFRDEILKGTLFLLVGAFSIGCGSWCVLDPEAALTVYLRGFRVGAEFKWYDPSTFLRKKPPLFATRLYGVMCVVMGLIVLFAAFESLIKL